MIAQNDNSQNIQSCIKDKQVCRIFTHRKEALLNRQTEQLEVNMFFFFLFIYLYFFIFKLRGIVLTLFLISTLLATQDYLQL